MTDLILAGLWRASWQGAVLFAVVAVCVRLTPRLSPAVHCWAWRIVCLKMLLAFFVVGAVAIPAPSWMRVTGTDTGAGSSSHVDRAVFTGSNRPLAAAEETQTRSEAMGPQSDARARQVDSKRSTYTPVSDAAGAGENRSWRTGLLLAWLGGIAWQTFRLWRDWKDVQCARRTATLLHDGPVVRLLRNEVIDVGLAASPDLYVDETERCPAVIGTLTPVIVVPNSVMRKMDEAQLKMLLRHELAHIRRGDLWWNWTAAATRYLFFFHPLVRIALREWRMNQESACDELAIRDRPEQSADYASLLLEIAVSKSPSRSLTYAVGVFESFETLKRRIEKMSHFEPRSSHRMQFLSCTLAVAAVAGLIPWKLVSSAPMTSASAVAATPDDSLPQTKVGNVTIAVADVADVSGMRHETRSDISRLMNSIKLNSQTKGSKTQQQTNSPNGFMKASGSGFGGGGGGGGFRTTRFAGNPKLAVAFDVQPEKNTQVMIVDHLIGIDENGAEHKSLPTSSTAFMICPDYEKAQAGNVIAYFTKDVAGVNTFAVLKGTLQIETAESDEVEFDRLKPNATKKTALGEYKITSVDKSGEGIKVALQTPVPKSLRTRLESRPRDAKSFQARMEAQRRLSGLIRAEFIGSDGNSYQPNTRGTHGSGQQTSSFSSTTTSNGVQQKGSHSFSSRQPGLAEYMYGLTKVPPGVKIVGLRARVLELPTESQVVDFTLKNVQVR